MAQKCALIVDDSKTARRFLGAMLQKHGIRVESAGSAESALEFLSDTRPDVIFMDHMMPGMDGFQAVRAIKNNPATATIPIMMYTSQSGELYVGQARALGAVGVLPKQIKPVEVPAMLESLHLIPTVDEVVPDEGLAREEPVEELPGAHTAVQRMLEPPDWGELHGWFEEMLGHHGQALRDDIEVSVARLLKEQRQQEEAVEEPILPPPPDPALKSRLNALTLLTVLLSFLAATFFWLQLDMRNKWRSVSEQNVALLEAFETRQQIARESSAKVAEAREQAGIVDAAQVNEFVETMEWTVNQFAAYSPEQVPLGDDRLARIDNLVNRLRAIGFTGVIRVDSHVGDFCFVQSESGSYALAPDELPVERCDRVGIDASDALITSAQQSVGFANYVAALNSQSDGRIRIEVDAHGNSSPSFPYPPTLQGITANEWNRIAGQNNRVQVSLLPDSSGYSVDASAAY